MEMVCASASASVSRYVVVIVIVIGLTIGVVFSGHGCYHDTGFVGLAADSVGACYKKPARRQSARAVGWSRKGA